MQAPQLLLQGEEQRGMQSPHCSLLVQVHMREMSPEGEEVIRVGKLYLVDLAGSENVNRRALTRPF